jgi:hypothetical protein
MIHAFNFTCARDLDLSILMLNTFTRHCPDGSISITNTDTVPEYKEYGNGSGWTASMMKLKALSDIIKTKNVQDNDFVLSVDSDVVFCTPEVFEHVKPEYGIIGTKHRPEFSTKMGSWSHMSGALIFFRGDVAKRIVSLTTSQLDAIRFKHFKPYNLTENEDVVLSYLARYVEANYFDLGGLVLTSGDFENDIAKLAIEDGMIRGFYVGVQNMKSFYHLNYCPTQFLGEPVTGKWDIARVLKNKGIEL